ncbi:MAG: hypothetical protein ACLFQQ_08030 [Desulfococcaceae bacterium]
MTDEEIDYSDIPSLPDSFLETARVWRPRSKVSVTVEMDADLLDWFQKECKDWRAGVQTARHVYVEGNLAYRQQSEENSTIRGAFFESSPVKLLFDLSL